MLLTRDQNLKRKGEGKRIVAQRMEKSSRRARSWSFTLNGSISATLLMASGPLRSTISTSPPPCRKLNISECRCAGVTGQGAVAVNRLH